MKLATYRDGSRDGQLVVVSRDLSHACFATGIATRLQQVLDDWNFMAPQLEALYQSLNQGRARHAFAFDSKQCLAPLPRPTAWLAGEAYLAHGAALRERGLHWPERLSGPLIRVGGAEALLGPHETPALRGAAGLEPEPQLAVVVGDLGADAVPSQALEAVRLLMVVNAWVLRPVQQEELAQGWPPLHSRPALQFAPVAITPDELPGTWYLGRAALQLLMQRNGRKQPLLDAKEGMTWSFGDLVSEAARRRPLRAGTVVGAGMPGGGAVLALKEGDSLRIDFKLADGGSPFGPIDMDLAEPQSAPINTDDEERTEPTDPAPTEGPSTRSDPAAPEAASDADEGDPDATT
ncbi:fumarylacetoacetate hydrolase family protein [Roseateles sp. SL47]|uniref:fumarylacetoacetate hydrolase family protein n=1 Tax=Roseateles sp. SL47 TaxID=2995138 RepID=UPI002270866F|nr:fumarylacetoacetate hydrolase family protein [Roseateles sp. SL47]WAC73834.1 fumarylacetoacetate hydrolase family protein [Roseateles sp. SL47]